MPVAQNVFSGIRSVFLVLLFGAITLPMLPIWQGGIRVTAAVVALLLIFDSVKPRIAFGALLTTAGLISLAGWFYSLLQHPVSHTIRSITDVFGQPIGQFPDLALLGFDLFTVSALGISFWLGYTSLLQRLFTCGLTIFWFLSLVTGLIVATDASIAQTATTLSSFATWVYWGLLGFLLFQQEGEAAPPLKVIAFAALLVGAVILGQWITEDYSYYLGSLGDSSVSFHRVRGTNYYHAPTALVTALGAVAFIGLMRGRIELWPSIGFCFLVGITILNNTRAISLSLTTALLLLAGLMALRRSWSLAIFAIIATLVIAPNIAYLKPSYLTQSTTLPEAPKLPTPAPAPEKPELTDNLAQANLPRLSLAYAGLALLPQHLIVGTGPGLLSIPLNDSGFDDSISTYSTHILFLDVALMSGMPAFFFFGLAILAAMISGLIQALKENQDRTTTALALLAILIVFSVASFFFPQERNEIIGVAFASAGLLLGRQEFKPSQWPTLQIPRLELLSISVYGRSGGSPV